MTLLMAVYHLTPGQIGELSWRQYCELLRRVGDVAAFLRGEPCR